MFKVISKLLSKIKQKIKLRIQIVQRGIRRCRPRHYWRETLTFWKRGSTDLKKIVLWESVSEVSLPGRFLSTPSVPVRVRGRPHQCRLVIGWTHTFKGGKVGLIPTRTLRRMRVLRVPWPTPEVTRMEVSCGRRRRVDRKGERKGTGKKFSCGTLGGYSVGGTSVEGFQGLLT